MGTSWRQWIALSEMCGTVTSCLDALHVCLEGTFDKSYRWLCEDQETRQRVPACIQQATLWNTFTILHLWQNMLLDMSIEAEREFAKWQLGVGQMKHTNEWGNITLPAMDKPWLT
jgi:hypothetical protein